MKLFTKDKEFDLVTISNLLQSMAIKYGCVSDMNDNFVGFMPFSGNPPKNLPSGTAAWGIAASFPLSSANSFNNNMIQFIFDLNGKFMYRTKDGSSGKMTWNAWKQIGGVLSSPLSHLYQVFGHLLVNRKVAF